MKTVLIIDDERDFLSTMQFFLENEHYRIITAATAKEGIEKACLKPDLILLDLKMPGISGYEVCKRLKENDVTRHIPVIMLTSASETLDKITAFDLGAADYVGKYFPVEEIMARVKAVLRETSPANIKELVEDKNKKVLELKNIIDNKNAQTLFQPIVDLSTKAPIGYEALVRGPQGSSLENPADLFAFAAEANMLFELDIMCRKMSVNKAAFLKKEELLFLNTDPGLINTDHFKKFEFLDGVDITPDRICLEITERTFVKNFRALEAGLKEARSKGVKIAIDDVGEGYSSLNAIAELKPEFLKVDIALVRGMDKDSVKTNLVRLIAYLAKSIDSRVIAEGVETEDEYEKLLSIGVEYAQGYFFTRPFVK
ncbi:MAG: EAL domain-containing response regulator [Candidatus Omnitrophota bacterium]|nr:EAL domain-containing response regulator [Candidatus Omnitrophota bacterium]